MNLVVAAIMGIVEGITEFIPVSSTGHLILAGHLLNFTGEIASTFEVFIQIGAIFAIVLLYLPKFLGLVSFRSSPGFSGVRGLTLLFLTTLPALTLGFFAHHYIKEHLFNPSSVAIGLVAGGIWLLVIEKKLPLTRKSGLDALSYRDALFIGLFQCLALWPGISRAAATILGAMMIGVERKTAAEYSFFAAVPVLFAAAALDLIKSRDLLQASDFPFFAVGLVVSFISAFLIVKFFIRYVSRHSLEIFGWYRIVLAGFVWLLLK